MNRYVCLLLVLLLTACGSSANAAIFVHSSDGKAVVTTRSLGVLATAADCAGKKIVFTTDQTVTANLIWPADRELVPENKARINHGAYTISFLAGQTINTSRWPMAQVFNGTGAVTGLMEARPEWFKENVTPGTTDMTLALEKAMLALPSMGGVLDLAATKYLHTTPLTVSKSITIKGKGHSISASVYGATTLIKGAGVSGAGITLDADSVGIRDLSYLGVAGNTGDGIVILGGRSALSDLAVYRMGQDGVRIGQDASGRNANLWRIDNLYSKENVRHGLHVSDKVSPTGADCNGGLLTHADLQVNGDAGLYMGNAQLNTFLNVVAQTNSGRGVSLSGNGAKYNTFLGGDFENNVADEFHIETGAVGNKLFGGVVTGSFTDNGTSSTVLGVSGISSSVALTQSSGIFTPNVSFDTPGDLAVAYTVQSGRYVKTGSRVDITVVIVTSSFTHSTASGALKIIGLPYTSTAVGGNLAMGSIIFGGYNSATHPILVPMVNAAKNYIEFRSNGPGVAVANPVASAFPSGGVLVLEISITYTV
jgi:hypothetical protein